MREDGLMPDDPPYRDFLQSGAPRSSAVKTPREVYEARSKSAPTDETVLVPLHEILKTIQSIAKGQKYVRTSELIEALR